MTVTVSRYVHAKFVAISWTYFRQEHSKFLSNFELHRNPVNETGAWLTSFPGGLYNAIKLAIHHWHHWTYLLQSTVELNLMKLNKPYLKRHKFPPLPLQNRVFLPAVGDHLPWETTWLQCLFYTSFTVRIRTPGLDAKAEIRGKLKVTWTHPDVVPKIQGP